MRFVTVNHGATERTTNSAARSLSLEFLSLTRDSNVASTIIVQKQPHHTTSSSRKNTLRQRTINTTLLHPRTIFELMAQRNENDDTCFVINRKLLRRRHVRKEQIRRQREAAKRRREAVNRIRTLEQQASTEIKSADSFSDLEALGDTYSNNSNDTQTSDHPAQTITVGNGNSQSNTRTFISTPLPFSPLRSKRRKLVMSS